MESMRHMNHVNTASYPADSINNKNHPDHDKPGFLVRAVREGYYGVVMRKAGDVFKINFARHFADAHDKGLGEMGWMERVNEKSPPRRRTNSEPQHAVGKRPPPPDPSDREAAMASVDEMTERSMAEDRERAEIESAEADVI